MVPLACLLRKPTRMQIDNAEAGILIFFFFLPPFVAAIDRYKREREQIANKASSRTMTFVLLSAKLRQKTGWQQTKSDENLTGLFRLLSFP